MGRPRGKAMKFLQADNPRYITPAIPGELLIEAKRKCTFPIPFPTQELQTRKP